MNKKKPASKLDNLQIWMHPTTKVVYAGYISGASTTHKIDITNKVVEAVAVMLDASGGQMEFPDGSKLVLLPPGAESPLYCDCVDPLRIMTPGGDTVCDNCGKYLPKN